jgi:hypothetical protein
MITTAVAKPDRHVRWANPRQQVLGCNSQHGVNVKIMTKQAAQFR